MKYLSKRLRIGVSLFFLILNSGKASAFPELIRDGYGRCVACHVQPNGGGPLNDYGRTIAGEHLSMFGTAAQGEALYGLANFAPFDVGGDYRYLYNSYNDKNIKISQRFAMQKEVSLIFKAAPNVTFLMSGGYYGYEPKEPEYRRYFGIVSLGNLWTRVGRFIPSFGYNLPDHTKGVKELFGQGSESLNVEIGYSYKWLEIIGTRLLGAQSELVADKKPKVSQKDSRDGTTLTLDLHPFSRFHMGVSSFLQQDDQAVRRYYSYHASGGFSRLYGLAEYQSYPEDKYRLYGEVGVVIVKGLHLKAEYDGSEIRKDWYGTIDLFPFPHFQWTISASQKSRFAIFHYYL